MSDASDVLPQGAAPVVVWFRRDLRAFDHPALAQAHLKAEQTGRPVTHIFFDEEDANPFRTELRESLLSELDAALLERFSVGLTRHRAPQSAAEAAAWFGDTFPGADVFVTCDYTPAGLTRDQAVADVLAATGGTLRGVGSPYLVDPGVIHTNSGEHFKVFTPFYRRWLDTVTVAPQVPAGAGGRAWRDWLEFVDFRMSGYAGNRDRPDLAGTSQMGAYLAMGAIHPRAMVAFLAGVADEDVPAVDRTAFVRELAFREFYADFLYHRPETLTQDVNERFARFPWDEPDERLRVWQEGRTGFPIVDAGMRQLAQTGWMHNRVRMIVASFLCKDLHFPWQVGAEYFRQMLIDYDPANNQHSWQWCAGTGTDASPYFRVFNPATQGRKFDPDARYIKKWVPELSPCSAKDIHAMRGLPASYPAPMVDHAEERLDALARYEVVKG